MNVYKSELNFNCPSTPFVLLQADIAECGLVSMGIIASYYGHQLYMPAMRNFTLGYESLCRVDQSLRQRS